MDAAHTEILERVARVLTGLKSSANASGLMSSAGTVVDETWRSHLSDAAAVLSALREPDADMIAVGDQHIWTRMVQAALGEEVTPPPREGPSWDDVAVVEGQLIRDGSPFAS
ncbi:MAG: hypothetical protein JWM33_1312 [Caulobacteraceae bacterium]|nr:hypothetical protein [Caulobacteraceae bacterium]